MANGAMFNAYAANAKRATVKKMFDADKARKKIERSDMNWKQSRQTSKWEIARMATEALKGFKPSFTPKKGG
jgi:PAB1-binding protein PBP1